MQSVVSPNWPQSNCEDPPRLALAFSPAPVLVEREASRQSLDREIDSLKLQGVAASGHLTAVRINRAGARVLGAIGHSFDGRFEPDCCTSPSMEHLGLSDKRACRTRLDCYTRLGTHQQRHRPTLSCHGSRPVQQPLARANNTEKKRRQAELSSTYSSPIPWRPA